MKFSKYTFNNIGTTVVEAAVTLPVFLFILIVGVQMAIGFYKGLAIHNVLSKTAREAIMPQNIGNEERVEAIKNIAMNYARDYSINLDPKSIRVCPAKDKFCRLGNGAEDIGTSENFISISIQHDFTILLLRKVSYSLEVFSRNEPR